MVTRLSLATLGVCGLLALAGQTATASDACAPGASDKPDLGFVDSNCDGIDGDKAAALFVAPSGNDNNDGSFGHPKATVAAAVTAALAAGKDVYVAGGTYTGKPAFSGPTATSASTAATTRRRGSAPRRTSRRSRRPARSSASRCRGSCCSC